MKTPEEYFNDKHPKHPVVYTGRHIKSQGKIHPIRMDVRNFVSGDCVILKGIIKSLNIDKLKDDDQKAIKILNYVKNNIRYVSDKINEGHDEFWQLPLETLTLGIGDCEDGAILMASLLINAGIPSYKVRVTAGLVKSGQAAESGGHAYCTYTNWNRKHNKNKTVALDWCYYYDGTPIDFRKELKEDPNYLEIWFSFNHRFSWSKFPLKISSLKESKKRLSKI